MDTHDLDVMRGIASSHDTPPRDRLRLLMDIGVELLNFDIVCAFVAAEATPFFGLFDSQEIPKKLSSRMPPIPSFWPFHYSGLYDPIPTYCGFTEEFYSQLLDNRDGPIDLQLLNQPGDPISHQFAERERVSAVFKLALPTPTGRGTIRPQLLLLFGLREGTDFDIASLSVFGDYALTLFYQIACAPGFISGASIRPEDPIRRQRLSSAFTDIIELCARIDSAAQEGTRPLGELLSIFADGLLNICLAVTGDPMLKGLYFSVARLAATVPERYLHAVHNIDCDDSEPRFLVPIGFANYAEFGAGPHQIIYPLSEAQDAVATSMDDRQAYRSRFDIRGREPWLYVPPPVSRQCSLCAVTAHLGMPLFLGDALRRFCPASTLYWRAFVEVSEDHRLSYAVPLLRSDSDGARQTIGAVVFEGPDREKIGRTVATFLYEICQIASALLDTTLADKEYELDPRGFGTVVSSAKLPRTIVEPTRSKSHDTATGATTIIN